MTQASGAKAENTIVRPSGFTTPSNTMDVPRAGVAKKKRQKRIIYIVAGVLGLIVVTFLLSRLKPAVPSMDRGEHGRPGRENRDLAGHGSETGQRDFGTD
jgi:hypothetical protein